MNKCKEETLPEGNLWISVECNQKITFLIYLPLLLFSQELKSTSYSPLMDNSLEVQ